jgi:O-antigen/teichoic acid export membrane protein
LAQWLPFVPLLVLAIAVSQIMGYWFNRSKQYRLIARCRIARSVAFVALTLLIGGLGLTSSGLLIGCIASQVFAAVLFACALWFDCSDKGYRPDLASSIRMAKRFRRFAIYSTPGDTINSSVSQMPLFILTSYFGPVVAGYYSLTQRVLVGPTSIVSRSIGDVFRQRASEDLRNRGDCRPIWRRTCKLLLLFSVPAYSLLLLVGPQVFAWTFGEPWRMAGRFAQVLVPFFMLSFTASILGRMTQIAEKQKEDLVWQAVLFLLVTLSLLIGAWNGQPLLSVGLFSISYSAMYLIYIRMSFCYSVAPNAVVRPKGFDIQGAQR